MVKKDRLKVGIIGLGVGERHIHGYLKHSECDVVALCDFSEDKLRMAETKYPEMTINLIFGKILKGTGKFPGA